MDGGLTTDAGDPDIPGVILSEFSGFSTSQTLTFHRLV